MPQMAPISWLSLFIIFSITFFLFNMMNYYSFLPPMSKPSTTNNMNWNHFNWKW